MGPMSEKRADEILQHVRRQQITLRQNRTLVLTVVAGLLLAKLITVALGH
jgi:hypothetical protein